MKGKHILERISQALELESEPIAGKPLIEIIYNRSVLVENHCGVVSYSTNRVIIKTKVGLIFIGGSGLRLSRMSCDQLRICGIIDSIELKGKKECRSN